MNKGDKLVLTRAAASRNGYEPRGVVCELVQRMNLVTWKVLVLGELIRVNARTELRGFTPRESRRARGNRKARKLARHRR